MVLSLFKTIYQLIKGRHIVNGSPTKITNPKEVFENWWKHLLTYSDLTKFNLKKVTEEFLSSYGKIEIDTTTNIEELGYQEMEGSMEYLSYLVRILIKTEEGISDDWSASDVGTLFIKAQNILLRSQGCKDIQNNLSALIEAIFTLPNSEVSLPEVVHLFGINNFMELAFDSDSARPSSFKPPIKAAMKPYFIECFEQVIKDRNLSKNEEEVTYYDGTNIDDLKLVQESPCKKSNVHAKCKDYCSWHKIFMEKTSKQQLIGMTKFGIPERKYALKYNAKDSNMAKKLFPPDLKLRNVSGMVASTSAVAFCYQDEYKGDDIGLYAKACNEFYEMPSDVGIVLSKDLDINTLAQHDKDYVDLFEPSEQSPNGLIKGSTLVFDVDHATLLSQTYTKDPGISTNKIKLQVHQSSEPANMITVDDNYDPIELEAGNEYYVEVYPIGQVSNEDFKAMNYEQRKCKLEDEVDDRSIFKKYTESNCKYECHVEIARETCGCVPWEYLHKTAAEECDVFGRTCFFKKMEHLKQPSTKGICKNCDKECDFFKFVKKVVKVEELATSPYGGKYFKRIVGKEGRINVGNKAFVSLLGDVNGTIISKGLKNIYRTFGTHSFEDSYPSDKYTEDMIVVHLKFKQPEVVVLSPKYTFFDMIGNFGGQFGLFEQVTGASFLGIINLIILLFKLMFPSQRNV